MRQLCVLLHGYPNNSRIWKEQLPLLEKHFQILNLSLPGSETGIVSQEDLKVEHIIRSVSDKIRATGNDHVILIGHDIGSFVLSEVAQELDGKVKKQIWLGGMDFGLFARRLRTSDQKFRSWYVMLFQTPVLPEILIPKLKRLLAKKLYPDMPELLEEAPCGFAPIGIYRELTRGIFRAKGRDKSSVPTLFLFGEDDSYISPPSQSEIQQHYKNASVKVLKGGHWFMREHPQEVNQLLEEFLITPQTN